MCIHTFTVGLSWAVACEEEDAEEEDRGGGGGGRGVGEEEMEEVVVGRASLHRAS